MAFEKDTIIEDSENYRGNKAYGFKEICLQQVQRVVSIGTKEMKGGFWIYSHQPNMNPEKIRYIGDSRKEYSQGIEVLHDILLPKFDNEMKEQAEKLENEILESFKSYNEQEERGKPVSKEFWRVRLSLYRQLFQQLCLFLNRIGWLEVQAIEDE